MNNVKEEDKCRPPDKEQTFKSKEQKRLEAEERNKISKTKNAWKKELAAVEEKIELLEARKTEHETSLCDPQTLKNTVKIKTINKELKDINSELEHSYNTWTELNSKLEQFDSVKEEIPSNQHQDKH